MKNDITQKISIVIPNYNGANTLRATIVSCLSQTLPPFEIFVCDDGSTDESKSIVENIKDNKIKWLDGKHTGSPGNPRNRGMLASTGDWIAFCDNDDEWLPNKLEIQMASVQKTDKLAVSSNALKKIKGKITDTEVVRRTKNSISFWDVLNSNDIVLSSAIIHSSIFKKIGGFTENVSYRSYADYIYWLRVLTQTDFCFVNQSLVIYRDEPENSIRRGNDSDELIRKNAFSDFIKWITIEKIRGILLYRVLINISKIKYGLIGKAKKLFHIIVK